MKLAVKKKTLTIIFVAVSVLVAAGIWIGISITRELPRATPGPAAEDLTDRIENYTGTDSWNDLAAIRYVFVPAHRSHLLDRRRSFLQVDFRKKDSKETVHVQLNLNSREGLAWKGNGPGTGSNGIDNGLSDYEESVYLNRAFEAHFNDLFWLNPFATLRAPGAVRRLTRDNALLVTYESGGVTPGDSYLIYAEDNGKPLRWLLWTQAIPARGIEFTFADWQEFDNGIRLNLENRSFLRDIKIRDVELLEEFPPAGGDPFQPLLERIEQNRADSED